MKADEFGIKNIEGLFPKVLKLVTPSLNTIPPYEYPSS